MMCTFVRGRRLLRTIGDIPVIPVRSRGSHPRRAPSPRPRGSAIRCRRGAPPGRRKVTLPDFFDRAPEAASDAARRIFSAVSLSGAPVPARKTRAAPSLPSERNEQRVPCLPVKSSCSRIRDRRLPKIFRSGAREAFSAAAALGREQDQGVGPGALQRAFPVDDVHGILVDVVSGVG